MEEIANKSKSILATTWITAVLSALMIALFIGFMVLILNIDTVEPPPIGLVVMCVTATAFFAGFGGYYVVLLVRYYRAPKTVITREGENLNLYTKKGWVTVALKDVSAAKVTGTFMKSNMWQMLAKNANGDLVITAGAQYKVLNVHDAEGAGKKILDLAEQEKIRISLGK